MPDVTSKVSRIKVVWDGEVGAGWVFLTNGDVFFMWWDLVARPTAEERLIHSMWLSLLQQALTTGRDVTVGFSALESSAVTSVHLRA
jgi:hypothetical protein